MDLMQIALKGERMLSITLETRKWYAGYVAEVPTLKPSEKYFRIIPILSGYRDKDTLSATRTISYVHGVLSARLRKLDATSEKIALGDPVMPVADGFGS